MNFSYYKIPIIVHDCMPGKPMWIQIESNSFFYITKYIFDIRKLISNMKLVKMNF